MCKIPLLVIVGPTASGKTALSVECALALNGEIVSADSMQIYKGMSVATAKPTEEEMRGVKHYLTDFLDLEQKYSVADFVCDAAKAIDEICKKNKFPILSGGTGLYIDSLVNNVKFTQADTDFELRQKLSEEFETLGADVMLEKLKMLDYDTAVKLHTSDKKRIIRAFEVFELTGKTMSQLVKESTAEPSLYEPCYIGINFRSRDKLYERINKRVDLMLVNGLVDEAERYYNLSEKTTASQAIGYKELKPYFDGEISLEQAVENLKKATRHYAKRQLTWFRRNSGINWFYPDDYKNFDDFTSEVTDFIKKVLNYG